MANVFPFNVNIKKDSEIYLGVLHVFIEFYMDSSSSLKHGAVLASAIYSVFLVQIRQYNILMYSAVFHFNQLVNKIYILLSMIHFARNTLAI